MRILIIRHADPDYSIDSLTEKGWREAEYLSQRLVKIPAAAYYCSPLGRARDTASLTLKKLNRTATECPWLREFNGIIVRPDFPDRDSLCWDWLPKDWTAEPRFFTQDWLSQENMAAGNVAEQYNWVVENLDKLVESHGYQREGNLYLAKRPNSDTIVLFCHLGVECVLLSRLLNIPPMLLWHGISAAPSSVTTLYTEERRPGYAYFRMNACGDTSHLYANGDEPAFAGRFRELYTNEHERRD